MSPSRSSSPPRVMMWGKAMPVIVIAVVFDLMRIFFQQFWFFGPAVAAVGCTAGVNSIVETTIAETAGKAVAIGCGAVAGAAGFYGVGVFETFGVIMAMAVGLAGFLTLGIWIAASDSRLFKVNKSGWLWLTGGLGVAEIPFIGTFPAFSVVLWILYRRQIKIEKAGLKRWQQEQAQLASQDRENQIAELMQMSAATAAPQDIY